MSWMSTLLREPEIVVSRLRERGDARPRLARLVFLAVAGSFLFGAALGCYVGRLQILLAAVKMPIFFLGTLAISFLTMHVFAQFAAPQLRMRQTFSLCLSSISTTAALLLGMAPIYAFIAVNASYPSYKTYLFLWLLLVLCVAFAGVISLKHLWRGLRELNLPRSILVAWVLIYGFVGSQLGWLLRPWVGSSYDVDGYFSLTRNLEGNFYESLFKVIVNLFR